MLYLGWKIRAKYSIQSVVVQVYLKTW